MSSRDQILAKIRNNRPQLERPLPEVPLFDAPPKVSLLEAFKTNLEQMGGLLLEPGATSGPFAPVRAKIAAAKVVCSTVPEIEGNREIADVHQTRDLADVDFAIVQLNRIFIAVRAVANVSNG
jgi:L-lactate dehydrogenase complex protein LldG